jgi:hypothetical protein
MENETRQKEALDQSQNNQEAAKAWESEKAALTTEVSRLQHAIGELIERANNPKRTSVSVRDDLQVQLNSANREKERDRATFLHERTAWEEEKARMIAEMEQLRLTAQGKFPRLKLPVDNRAKEKELEGRIAAMQKEIELERASAKLQIQMLERQISESRQAVETEADRVRKLTSEITIKINDPATELSTVIRKNVELAELNSYLKGMQYYLGKCKGR